MKKISFLAIFLVTILAIVSFATPAKAAGSRMVFSSDRSNPGQSEIYTMDEDGTNVVQVTTLGGISSGASWVPLSDSVIFRSDASGNYDLYTVNGDGTGLTNRTNSPEDESGSLASPDGTRIAYIRDEGGGTFNLYILNLSDNTTSIVNTGFTGFWWLSDSELVIYENQGSGWELYRINADGSGKTALTNDTGNSYFATASPNGQKIAYFYSDGSSSELRTVDSDGTNQATLATISDPGVSSTVGLPIWSPDSSTLLFLFNDTGNTYPLMKISAEGAGLSAVGSITGLGLWSPSGQSIWYSQQISGFNELFNADTNGSGAANITNSGANNEIFLSAFVFQSSSPNNPDPQTPPPTNPPASAQTLAASGSGLLVGGIAFVLLATGLGINRRRLPYRLENRV